MSLLIIDYSNFALEHGIYKINEVSGATIEQLQLPSSEIISYIKGNEDINKIKINAPEEYGIKIKEDMIANLGTEYARRQIEIEVI